jgi:uncharacterized membrane protein
MNPEILKNSSKIEKILHQIFKFGIFIKGFNGVWETIVGFVILFLSEEAISKPFYFVAVYFLIHGFLNLFLAIQLYRDRIWAYLVTIFVTIIFIFYQIHRIILHHSVVLTIITIFDILFIFLTWHEYKRKKYGVVV